MGAMYGRARVDDTLDFWQADNADETEWSCYQFEYSDDEEPIFSAFATEAENGTWMAAINPRYKVPTAHVESFPDREAAMEWCCSWAFCPERGQGESEYPELTLPGEVVRDLVKLAQARRMRLEAGSPAATWADQSIAETVEAEIFAKCAYLHELPARVRAIVRTALTEELSKTHAGTDLAVEVNRGMAGRVCDIEDVVPTSVIADLLKEGEPTPQG